MVYPYCTNSNIKEDVLLVAIFLSEMQKVAIDGSMIEHLRPHPTV